MTPTPLERLLFDCLRVRDQKATLGQLKALSDTEWTSLLELAAERMVAPMLWHRLLSPGLKPALPDRITRTLKAEQRRAATANMRIHLDFREVVLALHGCGIPVIALKGLHLVSLVYGDLALRATSDIDLLVPIEDLVSAGSVLTDLGICTPDGLPGQPQRRPVLPPPLAALHETWGDPRSRFTGMATGVDDRVSVTASLF